MKRSHALTLRAMIEKAAVSLTDTDALDAVELFKPWAAGIEVTAGERLHYGIDLYRVEQSHTTQAEWTPDITPALYTKVAKPGEIPVWKQPTGAQDAYQKGDKVHFPGENDPVYISNVDDNVWAPDEYGWDEEVI